MKAEDLFSLKAQGALEYLLILAGAVLIAAIVLMIMAGTGEDTSFQLAYSDAEAKCNILDEERCGNPDYVVYNNFCSGAGSSPETACSLSEGGDSGSVLDCTWNGSRCGPSHDYYTLKGSGSGGSGGGGSGGNGSGGCTDFNIDWSSTTLNAPWSGRHGHASVVFNGRMWIAGGYDGSSYLNDVWSSVDGVTWVQETPTAGWSGRNFFSLIVFNGKMLWKHSV